MNPKNFLQLCEHWFLCYNLSCPHKHIKCVNLSREISQIIKSYKRSIIHTFYNLSRDRFSVSIQMKPQQGALKALQAVNNILDLLKAATCDILTSNRWVISKFLIGPYQFITESRRNHSVSWRIISLG